MDERQKSSAAKTNFSIEHILNFAGKSVSCYTECDNYNRSENLVQQDNSFPQTSLSWLSCTRYCPPRIPRIQKENVLKKRRVGRQARIPFTSEQLKMLEEHFQRTPYLNATEVKQISAALQLGENRVKIWFQNRRARERRERVGNYERPERSRDNIIPIPATFESLISESIPSTSRTNININKITYDTHTEIFPYDTDSLSRYSSVYTSKCSSSQQTLNFTDDTHTTVTKYSRIEHPI